MGEYVFSEHLGLKKKIKIKFGYFNCHSEKC